MGFRTKRTIQWFSVVVGLAVVGLFAVSGASKVQAVSSAGQSCSDVQYSMTTLLDRYLNALKTCQFLKQDGQSDSEQYREKAETARDIEAGYAKFVQLCNSLCTDTTACNGLAPSGACLADERSSNSR